MRAFFLVDFKQYFLSKLINLKCLKLEKVKMDHLKMGLRDQKCPKRALQPSHIDQYIKDFA